MKKIILTILLITLIIPQIHALGIAPAKTETLELSQTYNLRIINNLNQDFIATIKIPNELSQYITLSQSQIEFTNQTQHEIIQITTNIPREKLNPGRNQIPITISKITQTQSQIAAQISLTHDLIIINPVQEPLLEFEILNSNFEPNKKGIITLKTTNIGLTQTTLTSTIKINQETIQQTKTIQSLETININYNWTPTQIGTKTIQAQIKYDQELLEKNKTILVGKPTINITSLTTYPFRLGEIAQIDLKLKNEWTNNLDVQITANIKQTNIQTTQQIQIQPNKNIVVPIYLNTLGLEPGNYDLEIQLNFEGIQTQKQYRTIITNNNIHILGQQQTQQPLTKNYSQIILFVSIIIVLTIIILSLYKQLNQS
ncbi:MAG: hypothetical protein ACMXX9_01495 [Candidatus Woesearchaeota archaeon]